MKLLRYSPQLLLRRVKIPECYRQQKNIFSCRKKAIFDGS